MPPAPRATSSSPVAAEATADMEEVTVVTSVVSSQMPPIVPIALLAGLGIIGLLISAARKP
jgi:hypothetical protein